MLTDLNARIQNDSCIKNDSIIIILFFSFSSIFSICFLFYFFAARRIRHSHTMQTEEKSDARTMAERTFAVHRGRNTIRMMSLFYTRRPSFNFMRARHFNDRGERRPTASISRLCGKAKQKNRDSLLFARASGTRGTHSGC